MIVDFEFENKGDVESNVVVDHKDQEQHKITKNNANGQLVSLWRKDELVDILDPKNEVYCPGKVLDVLTDGRYLIKYLGWEDTWNEVISCYEIGRIVSSESHVFRCKAWVNLSSKLSMWPSIAYVREPVNGSRVGVSYLRDENRLLIVPCGEGSCLKPYKHGVWFHVNRISPFSKNKDRNIDHGREKLETRVKEVFEQALEELHASDAEDFVFKFEGSLEINRAKYLADQRNSESSTAILDELKSSCSDQRPQPAARPTSSKGCAVAFLAKVSAGSRRRAVSRTNVGPHISDTSLKVILGNKRQLRELSQSSSSEWHISDHFTHILTDRQRVSLEPRNQKVFRKQKHPEKVRIRSAREGKSKRLYG